MNSEGTWNVIFIGHCKSRSQTVTNQGNHSGKKQNNIKLKIRISTFTCTFSLSQQGAVLSCIIRGLRTFSYPLNLTQMPQKKPSSGKCRWPLGTNTFQSDRVPPESAVLQPWKDRCLKSSWWLQHTNTHEDLLVQLDHGRLSFLIGYPSLPGGQHVIERVPADACSAERHQKEKSPKRLISNLLISCLHITSYENLKDTQRRGGWVGGVGAGAE